MRNYVNNWQYCWVRRRLLWTEQFWLPDVSFRMWGKRRILSLYTVFTQIWNTDFYSFLLAGKYLCRTYRSLSVISRCETPPQTHFSDRGLGKKFLSYNQWPSYSLLYKGGNTQMEWRGNKIETNHIRNSENMWFRFMFYSNIACTTDQCILPEKNAVYMKKSNSSFRA